MGRDLNMPILAIGAAFDYHAGLLKDTPEIIQNFGLQWLHRIFQDPGRLWRRYLITNTQFVILFIAQWLRLWRPDRSALTPPTSDLMFG
jgi:N-acetylglucosaminyldiphosphoundecaprenol N-acetyl-beta-D-mannosaminyltransferase